MPDDHAGRIESAEKSDPDGRAGGDEGNDFAWPDRFRGDTEVAPVADGFIGIEM